MSVGWRRGPPLPAQIHGFQYYHSFRLLLFEKYFIIPSGEDGVPFCPPGGIGTEGKTPELARSTFYKLLVICLFLLCCF